MSTVTLNANQISPNGAPNPELEQARIDLKTAFTNLESNINKISNPYLARDIVKDIENKTGILDSHNAISLEIDDMSQDVRLLIGEVNRKIKEVVSLSEHKEQAIESIKAQINRLCTSVTDELKKRYFPALVTDFINALNNSVKWNFVTRFRAKQTMPEIDYDKLRQWITTPNSSFGELSKKYNFVVPDALSASLGKIRDVASSVLDSPYKGELNKCVKQLNAQPENILGVEKDLIATQLIERIEAATSTKLPKLETEKQNFLKSIFSRLFSIPANQTLSDQEIDQKIRSMFDILKANPKISTQSLSQQINSLWNFNETNPKSSLLIDFAEFFAGNNPYERTLAEILIEVLRTGNTGELIGKALVYRRINSPISIKIDRALVFLADTEIKVYSKDDESVTLKVNEKEKKVEVLTHHRLVPESLKSKIDQVTKGYQNTLQGAQPADSRFCIEMKTRIKGVSNPFEPNMEYVFKKLVHKHSTQFSYLPSKVTEYTFSASDRRSPTISIMRSKEGKFTIQGKEQDINWESYLDLFHGLSWRDEILSLSEESLNTNILSLEQEPLANEGAIKKAAREKKAFKISIIGALSKRLKAKDPDVQEAIKWINNDQSTLLDSSIFDGIFKNYFDFENLCRNSLVLSEYSLEENKELSTDQKRALACDLLHELQTIGITKLNIEEQIESQDIISQLLEVIELTDPMKGVKGIGLMGPTGCGKSTSCGQLIGVPMKSFHQHGFNRLQALPFKSEEEYPVPKIGTSIGLSETLFTRAYGFYPPPPFVADTSNPFEEPLPHYPNFANGLNRESLKIIDFPGFFDTRGTDVEIVTNFSIDRAIESMKAVPAIFLIIPAEAFENNKGQQIHSSLTDLEAKFPRLLEDRNPLHERLHFLITKASSGFDEQAIRQWLVEAIKNCTKHNLPGAKYYSFLLNQLNSKRLHILDPENAQSRLKILNSVIKSYSSESDPIKNQYQGGFNTPCMQFKLGSVIEGALNRAGNLLNLFIEKQGSVKALQRTSHHLDSEIPTAQNKASDIREKIDRLNANPNDISIQEVGMTDAEEGLNNQINEHKESIQSLEGEIETLESDNKSNNNTITMKENLIDYLSTGTTHPEFLYKIDRKEGDQLTSKGTWAPHVDVGVKIRKAVDWGVDTELISSDGEFIKGSARTVTVGADSFEIPHVAVIKKEFQLVPSNMSESDKVKKLDELGGGVGQRSVFLDDGVGWRIDIESAGTIKFNSAAIHDSGTKIAYGFKEVCYKDAPYPKLVISAVLPKEVFNAKKIERLKSECAALEEKIAANKEKIKTKKARKKEYETGLEQLRTSLTSTLQGQLNSALVAQQRVVSGLKDDKAATDIELKKAKIALRRLAASINHEKERIEGTYVCAKHFKPTSQNNESVNEKNKEVLDIVNNFGGMCEKNIAKIREDVERIINEDIEIEFFDENGLAD